MLAHQINEEHREQELIRQEFYRKQKELNEDDGDQEVKNHIEIETKNNQKLKTENENGNEKLKAKQIENEIQTSNTNKNVNENENGNENVNKNENENEKEAKKYVINRKGLKEEMKWDKVTERLNNLANGFLNTKNKRNLKRLNVDVNAVTESIKDKVSNLEVIHTRQLDEDTAASAHFMISMHPDYDKLAGRIIVSSIQKETDSSFVRTMRKLHQPPFAFLRDDVMAFIEKHALVLESVIDYNRDYRYKYEGICTLIKNHYLMADRRNEKNIMPIERPQHMWMRVACGLACNKKKNNINFCLQIYEAMSKHYFVHATPTLFSCGLKKGQLASCFLLSMQDDSIDGIYDTLKQCAKISAGAGGIGISMHQIRAKGTMIKSSNGKASGWIGLLRVFNATAEYVDQGGGKRKGSFAVYLSDWHAGIEEWIELKQNAPPAEVRARDLFYALWCSDLFWERIDKRQKWSLFCPNKIKDAPWPSNTPLEKRLQLYDLVGIDFKQRYEYLEQNGYASKVVNAYDFFLNIVIKSMIETGSPYLLSKDSCNLKSNQQNLGTIRSSNLCTEIVQYSSDKEVAVCNLGSLGFASFCYSDPENTLDFKKSKSRQILSVNESESVYENDETNVIKKAEIKPNWLLKALKKKSHYDFYYDDDWLDSQTTLQVSTFLRNKKIFDIFSKNSSNGIIDLILSYMDPFAQLFDWSALRYVTKLAIESLNLVIDITHYPTKEAEFSNKRHRPIGLGQQGVDNVMKELFIPWKSKAAILFHRRYSEWVAFYAYEKSCELAKEDGAYETFEGSPASKGIILSDFWKNGEKHKTGFCDWQSLKAKIKKYGLRNSLMIAPMPTCTTATIFGQSECFEPAQNNLFKKVALNGSYIRLDSNLVKHFTALKIWDTNMFNAMIVNDGSLEYNVQKNDIMTKALTKIPDEFKELYKTVWEIDPSALIKLSLERAQWIDQSQSENTYFGKGDPKLVYQVIMTRAKLGLKTISYYCYVKQGGTQKLNSQSNHTLITEKDESESKKFIKHENEKEQENDESQDKKEIATSSSILNANINSINTSFKSDASDCCSA